MAFGVSLDGNSSVGERLNDDLSCVAGDLPPEDTQKATFLEKFKTSLDDCVPPNSS